MCVAHAALGPLSCSGLCVLPHGPWLPSACCPQPGPQRSLCVFPPYLGSQLVHFLRQVLSLQEKLILLVKQLHQLLRCSLAMLIQLPESAEKEFEMSSESWLLWRA